MSIWKQALSVTMIAERGEGTLSAYLGIRYTKVEDQSLIAEMKVQAHHLQPAGIMNGGVSCALAESVASAAANYCCSADEYCVGLDINTNHIGTAVEGDFLIAEATPFHLGRSTQVWSIRIENGKGKLVSINRLTLVVKKRNDR